MSSIKAKVVSVHIGKSGEFSKEKQASITAEIDGIVGDRQHTIRTNVGTDLGDHLARALDVHVV